MNFDRAFDIVVGIEKGYVNDPEDPGVETNFGISKRQYPGEDIKNLTLDRAKFLFNRDYWLAHKCDTMEWGKALIVFDTAVNGGHTEVWWSAFGKEPLDKFLVDWQGTHAYYLSTLKNWEHDGRGWMKRLFMIYDKARSG